METLEVCSWIVLHGNKLKYHLLDSLDARVAQEVEVQRVLH